jgi:hypothetical protein
MSGRRGGIPGPESRTGLVRPPAMTEAEFERQQAASSASDTAQVAEADPPVRSATATATMTATAATAPSGRNRALRGRGSSKPRRVQRMFAIEEELDKKLWLYAIHVGKDRSEVINDLLRPLVASMVLYDSRDRRGTRSAETVTETDGAGEG